MGDQSMICNLAGNATNRHKRMAMEHNGTACAAQSHQAAGVSASAWNSRHSDSPHENDPATATRLKYRQRHSTTAPNSQKVSKSGTIACKCYPQGAEMREERLPDPKLTTTSAAALLSSPLCASN